MKRPFLILFLLALYGCHSDSNDLLTEDQPEPQQSISEPESMEAPTESDESTSESPTQSIEEQLAAFNAVVMPNSEGGIRSVIFDGETVSQEALVAITKAKEVEILSLSGTAIGDAELGKISSSLPNLKVLLIGGTKVTDEGLVHLSSMTNLQRLGLGETQVSDQGLKHLVKLENLKQLFLAETQVTEAGVTELQATLPDCEIER